MRSLAFLNVRNDYTALLTPHYNNKFDITFHALRTAQ